MDHSTVWIVPRTLFVTLFLSTAMSVAGSARANCSAEVLNGMPGMVFHLPADDLVRTVSAITRQAGLQYMQLTGKEDPAGVKTLPVEGTMTVCAALDVAMKGTGYEFEIKDRTVFVYYAGIAPAAGKTRTTEPDFVKAVRVADVNPTSVRTSLDEVLVTGSYFHDVNDVIAPVIRMAGPELNQGSFGTVQDALYTLPLNSLSAPREDFGANGNSASGAGLNLRGLGTGATLVLVNGYRQPSSGIAGEFTDVSEIPWSAIERVDVLPDGSSAQYGSDAIAGVVNIVLRRDFEGAETQVRVGGAPGGRDETLISQLLGKKWDSGNVMLAYQFSDASALANAARGYAADTDKRPYGGGDYRSTYSNPGNILDPNTFLPAYGLPQGQDGTGLKAGGLSTAINLENQFGQATLFPSRRMHNVYLTGSQHLTDTIEVFADGRYLIRNTLDRAQPSELTLAVPRSNPFFVDPFGGSSSSVLVNYSFSQDLGAQTRSTRTVSYDVNTGVRMAFGGNWRLTASQSYGRDAQSDNINNVADTAAVELALADPNPATAFNPFGDGLHTSASTLNAIRASELGTAISYISTTRIVGDGPIFRLPAGDLKVAVGAEHRLEMFSHSIDDGLIDGRQFLGRYGRHIDAIFSELYVPLLRGPESARPKPLVDLTLSARSEHYNDFGQTTNPQARLRWAPGKSLTFRVGWGTAFRAPTLDDLYDTSENASGLALLPDSKSPTGQSLVVGMQGTNAALKPETATTWTAGLDWVPDSFVGLSASLTYYAIDYKGQIAMPADGNVFGILLNENQWAGVITRNPTAAQVAAICNRPDYIGPRSACLSSSPAAIVDIRLANLGETRTQGLDLEAYQSVAGALGHLTTGLRGSEVLRYDQAVTSSSPSQSVLNTLGNPMSLRLRGTIDWTRSESGLTGPGANIAINYTGGYRDPQSPLIPRVSPWATMDVQFRYRVPEGDGWLADTEFDLNVVNVFNQSPPFVDWVQGYDWFNTQPLGRVTSLFLRKRW